MNKQLYTKISNDNPWFSFLFQQDNGSVRIYGCEAVKAASILERTYVNTEDDMPTIELTQDQLHALLPQMIKIGCKFKMIDAATLERYEKEAEYERIFYVRCSRDQLIQLGDYMNDNGIHFEKLSNCKLQPEQDETAKLCKTDIKKIDEYIEIAKETLKQGSTAKEQNKARLIGLMIKKITKSTAVNSVQPRK